MALIILIHYALCHSGLLRFASSVSFVCTDVRARAPMYTSPHTQPIAHTHTYTRAHIQSKAICHSFVQSSSLSPCFWEHAREVASVVVGQSAVRGEDGRIKAVSIKVRLYCRSFRLTTDACCVRGNYEFNQ